MRRAGERLRTCPCAPGCARSTRSARSRTAVKSISMERRTAGTRAPAASSALTVRTRDAHRALPECRHTVQPQDRHIARSLTPAAPADGRASAAPAVPGSLVPPLGLGGYPRALPGRPGSHRDACRSGDRPCPRRPRPRRLSPRGRWGALRVAYTPDDRHGYRLADFSASGTPTSGAGNHLFRNSRCRGVGDLVREGCRLASSMIAGPGFGFLDRGATGLVTNGGMRAEPLGALPLGLGQAEPLTAGGLAAGRAAVRGRAPRGAPFDGPPHAGFAHRKTSATSTLLS